MSAVGVDLSTWRATYPRLWGTYPQSRGEPGLGESRAQPVGRVRDSRMLRTSRLRWESASMRLVMREQA